MELDYLNILWMKHENMFELESMDEIVLCQLEHIYMDEIDELDEFNVYKNFPHGWSLKTWNYVAIVSNVFLTLPDCGNEDAK